mmetsp:Transcript_38184/g.120245  ORF Transcript_38184/g.120245 Transcript_38184/m.120245 type:complete len:297 (-) Transcript_38184:51-941(-)
MAADAAPHLLPQPLARHVAERHRRAETPASPPGLAASASPLAHAAERAAFPAALPSALPAASARRRRRPLHRNVDGAKGVCGQAKRVAVVPRRVAEQRGGARGAGGREGGAGARHTRGRGGGGGSPARQWRPARQEASPAQQRQEAGASLGGHHLGEERPVARKNARHHREARRVEHDAVESNPELLVDRRRPKRLELAVEREEARRRRGLRGGRQGRALTQRFLVRTPLAGPLQRSRAGGGEICDAGGAQQLQRLTRQQRQQVQRRQRLGHLDFAQRAAVLPLVPRVDSGGLSRR